MSSSGYDLGPAVNGGQGDETSNLGDTTATVMARLDVALKDMPGVTTLDKLNTLMSKVAAAKELLGGLEPDVLLQARSKVDEPDRELSMSPALVKAYEQISKTTHGTLTRSKKIQTLMSTADAPEDEFEAAVWAAFETSEESEISQEGTHPQEPRLQDTHRILQPPRVRYVILSVAWWNKVAINVSTDLTRTPAASPTPQSRKLPRKPLLLSPFLVPSRYQDGKQGAQRKRGTTLIPLVISLVLAKRVTSSTTTNMRTWSRACIKRT